MPARLESRLPPPGKEQPRWPVGAMRPCSSVAMILMVAQWRHLCPFPPEMINDVADILSLMPSVPLRRSKRWQSTSGASFWHHTSPCIIVFSMLRTTPSPSGHSLAKARSSEYSVRMLCRAYR